MKKYYVHLIIWPTIIACLMMAFSIAVCCDDFTTMVVAIGIVVGAIIVAVICAIFIIAGFVGMYLEKYKK